MHLRLFTSLVTLVGLHGMGGLVLSASAQMQVPPVLERPVPLWSNALWFQDESKDASLELLSASQPAHLSRDIGLRVELRNQCTGNAANNVCRARYDRYLGLADLGPEGDTREPFQRCEEWTRYWRQAGFTEVGWRRSFCLREASVWLADLKRSRIPRLEAEGKTCEWVCEQ